MEAEDSNGRSDEVHSSSRDYVEPSEKGENSSFQETEMVLQLQSPPGASVLTKEEDAASASKGGNPQSSPGASVVTKEEDTDSISDGENGNPTVKNNASELQSDSETSSVSSGEVDNRVEDVLEREPFLKDKNLEEGSTSSNLDPSLGVSPRREVYKIPEGDLGGDENGPLLDPAGLIVQAVGFQVRFIVRVVGIFVWLTNICFSLVCRPVTTTLEAKDVVTNMATGIKDQGFGLLSFALEGASQTTSAAGRLTKRTIWGCLIATYIIFMLGLLLIPALFLDLILVNSFVEEPVYIHQVLDFDYSKPQPVALVPLFSPEEFESIKNLAPDKIVSTRIIPAGHMFHITVILTLPESEYNMNLGMFQLTAELLSAENEVLLRSSKPSRLHFSSFPVRLAKTILYSVPLLMGIYTEAQKLEIRVLEAQEKAIPTASVRLSLESKAGYHKMGGVPELYKAEICLQSTLPWRKAVLRNWKWTIYLWIGIWLFLFEVSFVLCCCRGVLIPSTGGKRGDEKEVVVGEVKVRRPIKENSSQRKTRTKRRANFEEGMHGAAGAEDVYSNSFLEEEVRDTALAIPLLEEVAETGTE